jgi:hypothetical protein
MDGEVRRPVVVFGVVRAWKRRACVEADFWRGGIRVAGMVWEFRDWRRVAN